MLFVFWKGVNPIDEVSFIIHVYLIGTMLEISTPAGLDIGPTTTCWANVRFSARSSFKIHHPAVWWSIMCANQMLDFIDVVSISNVRPRATAESTSPLSVSWFSIWLFSFFICVFPSDPARSRSNKMRGVGKGGDPSDHTHTECGWTPSSLKDNQRISLPFSYSFFLLEFACPFSRPFRLDTFMARDGSTKSSTTRPHSFFFWFIGVGSCGVIHIITACWLTCIRIIII